MKFHDSLVILLEQMLDDELSPVGQNLAELCKGPGHKISFSTCSDRRAEIWDRWQAGEPMSSIGRRFDRESKHAHVIRGPKQPAGALARYPFGPPDSMVMIRPVLRANDDRRRNALITAVNQSKYVEPSKVTVAEFVRVRVDHWKAAGDISARTAARYRELVENQIVPHIGAKLLQKLRTLDIEEWHTTLRTSGRANGKGGLAPRTIGHAHRVLGKALRDAAKNEMVVQNVVASQSAPKVDDDEMVIVKDVPAFIELVRGHRLFVPAMISLFTGMRLGEVLALRWGRVDLDRKVVQVREALEETKAHGIRFKTPKSKAGRRDLTLPDFLVDTLREFRKGQLESRLAMGLGKLQDDALLFAGLDGALPSQKRYSKAWSDFADQIKMPDLAFHNLRHTHASQLIDAGVDIVTISKRLGHAKPDITLRIYAHLFQKDDGKAAAAINAALNR